MAANNNITPEELRRLEKLRLNDSFLPYKTNDDRAKVEVKIAPNAPGGAEGLDQRMESLGLTGNTKDMAMSLSAALMSNRPQARALVLTETPDPFANGSLEWFQVDMTKDTVEGIIGTEINQDLDVQRRFASYKFKSDAMRQQTLKDLVMFCYMKALAPITDEEATAAFVDARDVQTARQLLQERRGRQQIALINYMGSMNTAKTINEQQKFISREVENTIMRKNNLSVLGKDMVCAPLTTGHLSSPPPDVLKSLNANISQIPFGSTHNSRSLKFYLNQVTGIINGSYNQKGAYHILMSILTGKPRNLVENHMDNETAFEVCWMDLQLAYGQYGQSQEGILTQIKNCLRTRPSDVFSAIAELRDLIIKKNMYRDPSERELITNSESKECIFSLLSVWYPNHVTNIRHRFETINTHAIEHGYKSIPAPVQLLMLAKEYIKNTPPVSQKHAEIHAISVHRETDALSEENMYNDTNAHLAHGGPDIYAFHTNQQQPGRFFGIPEHLKDKCLKCASTGHIARNCLKYPNEPIGQTVCIYCNGKHSSRCKNLEINELALPGQEDVQTDHYEEQLYQLQANQGHHHTNQ